MNSPAPVVAVLGGGPIADRLVDMLGARKECGAVARIPDPRPPSAADCVIYLPSAAERAADAPKEVISRLLREGYDVVTTLPPDDHVPAAEILDACRTGGTTFHATGAFPAVVATRVCRALSEVTSDIRRVDLREELVLPEAGVHPWEALRDTGIGGSDTEAATAAAEAIDSYYAAGLRVLDEAIYRGTAAADTSVATSVRVVTGASGTVESVVVDRELGPRLGYRSVWTAAPPDESSAPPLRYELVTATDTARGTTGLEFRFTGGLHPADHLTCVALADAVVPVHRARPGIARRDLSITGLIPDDRLA